MCQQGGSKIVITYNSRTDGGYVNLLNGGLVVLTAYNND